jgi:hypothetical protein
MQIWLLIAAALQAASAAHPGAEMHGLAPADIGRVATARAVDLRVTQQSGLTAPIPLLRGMIVQHGIAPNAVLGVGLANLYARRKLGYDPGNDGRPKRSRKPAVTFVLKF